MDANIRLVQLACKELSESSKFHALMGVALRLGNRLNQGKRSAGAGGFRLAGLLRLKDTKSADKRTRNWAATFLPLR